MTPAVPARDVLTVDELTACPRVRHAFFTRHGGVSDGPRRSLNCALAADEPAATVMENRARAMAALGLPADRLVLARQVHSARALAVEAPFPPGEAPEADGLATDRPGLALGVLTADCAPVLFADAEAGVIGAAHAGWRGARGGVLEATLAVMEDLGARRARVVAAVGPCIGPESYEVGPEFRDAFLADDPANRAFFAEGRRPGHPLFDLPGYVCRRLREAGIGRTAASGGDTFAEPDRYFSYRRAAVRGEPDFGRSLSAIVRGA